MESDNEEHDTYDEEWSSTTTKQLIYEVELRPCLWRKSDEQFKSKSAKRVACEEIAAIISTTPNAVKAKIRSLRTIFLQNLRKKSKNGSKWRNGEIKWEFFNSLLFMQDEAAKTDDIDSISDQTTMYMDSVESDEETFTPTIAEPSPMTPTISSYSSQMRKNSAKETAVAVIKDRLWDTIMSSVIDTRTPLPKVREGAVMISPNDAFGQYVSTTLDHISVAAIADRAKLQIKLILSKASLEAAETQLLSEDAVQTIHPTSIMSTYSNIKEESIEPDALMPVLLQTSKRFRNE